MTQRSSYWLAIPAATLLLSACAGDISPDSNTTDDGDGTTTLDPAGPGGDHASFGIYENRYYQATIDASGGAWIYIDLETQTQVTPADPESSTDWDIAFQAEEIMLNGGVSGTPPSGSEVAIYADKVDAATAYPFEDLTAAIPSSQGDYLTDEAGGLFGLGAPDLAMTTYPEADESPNFFTGVGDHGWYHDDSSSITPRLNVGYIVRSVECAYFKLRMTAYDDGHPQFDFLEIPGDSCGNGGSTVDAVFDTSGDTILAEVDASSEDDWVYVDLTNAAVVTPSSPGNDADSWDIALRRTDIKLNSGASGIGSVELLDLLRDDWDSRTTVPADGDWHTDAGDEAYAFVTYPEREVGGECTFQADGDYGWYYYSGFCDKGNGNHHVSPRDVVYLIRGGDDNVWKLRILEYYGDDGTAANFTFEYTAIATN